MLAASRSPALLAALAALLPLLATAAPPSRRWSYLNNLAPDVRSSLEAHISNDDVSLGAVASGNTSLAGAAARSARYVGNAWQSFYLATSGYGEVLDSQFDCYTPENEMKWEVIEPTRGVFNWTGADIIFDRAKQTDSLVRVHNFCWSSQTPSYVTNITDPTELKAVLKSHIDAVMGRYCDRVYTVDVVNEPLQANGTYVDDVWYNVLGEDYIPLALNYTRDACPTALLAVNDYGVEGINEKSAAYAKLAAKYRSQGVKWDVMGFESHFIVGEVNQTDIEASMKQFTDLGMLVQITELDIRGVATENGVGVLNYTDTYQQARDFAAVVDACENNANCPGVTVWNFDDNSSWVPGVFAPYGDATLYYQNLAPKPAYYAMLEAFQQRQN